MSVHVTSYVLRHSEARLGDRLVLLALGDHAHHDGSNAYATVEKLALEARLSERQVRRCLRNLEADGHIESTGVAEHGQIIYRVLMGGHIDPPVKTTGGTNETESRSDLSPKPSIEPSGTTSDEVVRVCHALADHVEQVTGKRPNVTQEWTTAVERMKRIDGADLDEVERFVRWLGGAKAGDPAFEVADFWSPNILSGKKLRAKYPQVRAQAVRDMAKAGGGTRRRDGMTEGQYQEALRQGQLWVENGMKGPMPNGISGVAGTR